MERAIEAKTWSLEELPRAAGMERFKHFPLCHTSCRLGLETPDSQAFTRLGTPVYRCRAERSGLHVSCIIRSSYLSCCCLTPLVAKGDNSCQDQAVGRAHGRDLQGLPVISALSNLGKGDRPPGQLNASEEPNHTDKPCTSSCFSGLRLVWRFSRLSFEPGLDMPLDMS